MRILTITSAYPARRDDPRGIFIHHLAVALASQGLTMTVLAPGAPDAPLSETRDGVSVQRVNYWLPRWQGLAAAGGIVPNLRRNPAVLAQVPALISALTRRAIQIGGDFDLVHAHWIFPSGIAGRLAARRHRIPLVVTSHGGDLNLSRRAWPLRALVRWTCRDASACVGVSHAMVGEFVHQGILAKKVLFIPLGVSSSAAVQHPPTDLPSAFREHRGLRAVYVGNLIPGKSVQILLQAHAILESQGYDPATLLIGDGPSQRDLQQKAKVLGLRNVTFIGSQPHQHIASYMRTANVLVLPSRSEGRGPVLLEAMEAGLPVIASDIPGPREVVRQDETGMLFPVGKADALARCLQRLIDDPGLGPRLGAGGREFVRREKLTFQESARLHIQLYQRLTSGVWTPRTQTSQR